jgi:predicted ATPase
VLGFDIRSDDQVPGLVAALRDRRLLLVLDNCEHVIEAAATLAAAILRGAADVHILATSREPLRAEGCSSCRRCRAAFHRTILAPPKRLRFPQ